LILSGRKIARNVIGMATTREAPAAEVATTELAIAETPEIVKTIQEAVRISNYLIICDVAIVFLT